MFEFDLSMPVLFLAFNWWSSFLASHLSERLPSISLAKKLDWKPTVSWNMG